MRTHGHSEDEGDAAGLDARVAQKEKGGQAADHNTTWRKAIRAREVVVVVVLVQHGVWVKPLLFLIFVSQSHKGRALIV